MVYVALLRGINVGGKNKVEMAKLKISFEHIGLRNVKTYINSGNVIFQSDSSDKSNLVKRIETEIKKDFGFNVSVLIRSLPQIKTLLSELPESWVNNQNMKCDVMFLQPEIDKPAILKQIPYNPEIEDVRYYPGTVVWRIDRNNVNRGKVIRIIGSDTYKRLTIRNANSVRKLHEIMKAKLSDES